ncbi:MAG: hypothetical protein M3315_01330 [Actinomycetota bacterium]|nr:hypothetical protein [Actinomycetota bacterium]
MQTVVQRDLPRFRVAIEVEVPMVMVGHLVYPDKSRPPRGPLAGCDAALAPGTGFGRRASHGRPGDGGGHAWGTTAARAALAAVMVGVDLLMKSGPLRKQAAAYEAVVTQ